MGCVCVRFIVCSMSSGFLYEVRNYFFEPSQFEVYTEWITRHAAPALKGLLPQFGGEVLGIWISLPGVHAPPEYKESGEVMPKPTACTPTNVTWIIRWRNKEERDAGFQAALASERMVEVL